MFNKLFGKKEKVVTEVLVAEPKVSKRKYPKEVEAIHNEFFTAGDNILQEATCLLKQLEEKDLAKGKRLAALGFNKTREAVVAIETENKLATTKEIADLVMYYRINYPNNKFITEEQVKQICKKYGLVCGNTSMYKGFVPESKLSMIESFKCKPEDLILGVLIGSKGEILTTVGIKECKEDVWGISKGGSATFSSGNTTSTYFSKRINSYFSLGHSYLTVRGDEAKMKICAPLKDMEIPSTHKVNGYKVQHIPDPVVLQPVNGGYLIVCAWGDEASDEIVVNQDMN